MRRSFTGGPVSPLSVVSALLSPILVLLLGWIPVQSDEVQDTGLHIMSVRLQDVTKEFLPARRGRRPLYRELINLGSAIKKGESTVVLNRISIEIPDGARIAVIGGNGVGKSTLLRLIAGIYQPTAGTVSVDGQVCCFLEPGAGAAPALPVRDNIFLYASLAGLNRAETRCVPGSNTQLQFSAGSGIYMG